jgi:hypothetical protein
MTMDGTRDRVAYLLRAARRAEGEGNARAARIFRLMARDARPADTAGLSGGGVVEER